MGPTHIVHSTLPIIGRESHSRANNFATMLATVVTAPETLLRRSCFPAQGRYCLLPPPSPYGPSFQLVSGHITTMFAQA